MKTKLEIQGDTFDVKKKAPTIIIDNGKEKKIPGKTVKIGDTTHIHIYGEKETSRKRTEKRSLNVKEIIAAETRSFYRKKIEQEEKKLRTEIKENLAKKKATEEAIKRHKLLVLLRGSPKFRAEFWGDPKLVHSSDPFKNNLPYIQKLQKNKAKWNAVVEKVKKSGRKWEDGSLLRKYQPTLNNIISRHSEFTDKLSYQALFQKAGVPFEKFCEITKLKKFGLQLNPTEFIRLPFYREYRADLAKMKYLALAKGLDVLKTHEKNLAASQSALSSIERRRTEYYEQLRRKAA